MLEVGLIYDVAASARWSAPAAESTLSSSDSICFDAGDKRSKIRVQ